MRPRPTHREEVPGGWQLFITIAMPLDPVFGFAMVVFFFGWWMLSNITLAARGMEERGVNSFP